MPALTGLRFFLALWVILHHLTGKGQSLEAAALQLPSGLYSLIRYGYMAVATFFVLSGFVLARSYEKTRWDRASLIRYGVGRFARVYPVYLLSLAAIMPFVLADRTPHKSVYAGAYALLLQGWLGPIPVYWNTPAWSLSCEIFFYLAFPALAALLRNVAWRGALMAAGGACVLTRVAFLLGLPDEIKPLVHLSDFLMGIAAARIYDLLIRGRKPSGAWLYAPGLLLGAALLAYPGALPKGVDLGTALRPVNAIALIGLGLGGGPVARALSSRVAVYLGKSSYAMYILHIPILWWYRRWYHDFSPAIYVAAVIAISALVYGAFEAPVNRWIRKRLTRPRTAG